MTKITIMYPRGDDTWFDFDYYLGTHMPMSANLIGSAMSRIVVERVITPGAPYPDPAYHAICTFECPSREAFEAAFLPHMAELQADTPNYTDSQQIVLVTETALDLKGGQDDA